MFENRSLNMIFLKTKMTNLAPLELQKLERKKAKNNTKTKSSAPKKIKKTVLQ